MNSIKRLFIDFDQTLVLSIKRIVELYHQDFHLYKNYEVVHWTEVNSWEFKELKLISAIIAEDYFSDFRFFQKLEMMGSAKEVLNKLKDEYKIYVCSLGTPQNLRYKREWIDKHLPFVEFVGVNMNVYDDKSCIDMSGATFIDDSEKNLLTSNAEVKICFGDEYYWNENWKGKRCYNWLEVEKLLMEVI